MISKLFWALVIAAAVVVLVPSLREKAWPKVQPAFNPLYQWNARNHVNEIRDIVKRADSAGRTVPTGDDFTRFVQSEGMQEDAAIDPWGVPYYLSINGSTFQVGSAGKDRQPGTADDVLSNPEPLNHVPDVRRF